MTAEWRRDPYMVSTDASLVDLDVVHRFLSEESYWSRGVSRDTVARSIAHSLVFGVYHEAGGERRQAGFARAITDRATTAYVADVFVLPEHRARGLGAWLIECMRAHPDLQGLRVWRLATLDAHGLYEKHGFRPLAHPERMMEIIDPDVYAGEPPEGGTEMKAAVYYETGAPDVFRYEEVPDPPLHPKGVLIDVKAIAIEGGDVLNRAGGAMTSKPHIVGYNCAGIVREAGAEVTDRKPGDRVTALMANGSHAAVVSVPSTSTWLVPDGCSIEAAACVPVSWGTAHDCLFEFGRLKAGETVLVQAGTSGVGIACVQLAKRAGARVIATSSSDEKLERLKQYGMDHGVNYRSGSFVDGVRAVAPQGVDLVVDSVGGKTLEGSLMCLGYRGRAITVGNVSREGKAIDVSALSGTNGSLTGVFFGLETFRSPGRVTAIMEGLLRDVAKGELRVVVDRTYPLSEAAAAHAHIESRAAFGRVVLVP